MVSIKKTITLSLAALHLTCAVGDQEASRLRCSGDDRSKPKAATIDGKKIVDDVLKFRAHDTVLPGSHRLARPVADDIERKYCGRLNQSQQKA